MTCQHCNADLPPFALFCGECGRSVSAPIVAPPIVERPVAPASHPTVICAECGARGESSDRYCAECGGALSADTQIIERLVPVVASAPATARAPGPEAVTEVVPEAAPEAVLAEQPSVLAEVPPALMPAPVPAPIQPSPPAPAADVESTRLVPRGTGGARFVLQFSTGESYTVLGSGLAGRNPHPEPGEYVDHLVTIVDPGRSISKTHFEFGQHEGVFWLSDRHSGNGSIIREPGSEARVCEPGRRYPIVRGTRVDIGEQFVVVS